MSSCAHILLIEDDPSLSAGLQTVLAAEGYRVTLEVRGDLGLAKARGEAFDLVLTDFKLPALSGLELVRQLHDAKPRLPIILMTAHGSADTAIEATKFGAYDYLLKPFEMEELLALVAEALASSRRMTEPVALGAPAGPGTALVGSCRAMQIIYKEIGRLAARPVSVLIRGETGTGKELIARALYQYSDRAAAPFIAINCAAIPETLLESELFGHERGAFTGADARRIGRFEQANGGTLFLDEIGDLSPGTQVKLLRVLQEKSIQRLGGSENITVDVRVITATHRDLEAMIREGAFREDLFYRLNVATVSLPPLRERREDIPELVNYFLRRHGPDLGVAEPSIQPDAVRLLQSQPWPGNVRELENVLRKILLLTRGYTITPEHIRAVLAAAPASGGNGGLTQPLGEFITSLLVAAERGEIQDARDQLITTAERELVRQAMDLAQGNQSQASRWLGVSRLTLREKLNQFGLHPKKENPE
jgi:nitrogen regulation protein NR(I)